MVYFHPTHPQELRAMVSRLNRTLNTLVRDWIRDTKLVPVFRELHSLFRKPLEDPLCV